MSQCHRPATASAVRPSAAGGPEKPKLGSDGATTVNASPGSPPCVPGSMSRGSRSRYSQNELGQPCVSSSGSGAGPRPCWCTRWTACPPTTARTCANRSSRAANAPVSNRCQSASRPASQGRGTPRSQAVPRSEEHTSELQSRRDLVCRLLLEKKKKKTILLPPHKNKNKKTK